MTGREFFFKPVVISEALTKQAAVSPEFRKYNPNDLVEKLFTTSIPEELWHYTSMAGLEGILKSGRIWATEARFTTDSSEFTHARDVALNFLQQLAPASQEELVAKQLVTNVITTEFDAGFLSQSSMEVFVASFSSAENLKSQWAEYANQSQGVSIAFDLRKVRPPAQLQLAVTLAPCVYDAAHKQDLLEAALRNLMHAAEAIHRGVGDPEWVKNEFKNQLLVSNIYNLSHSKEQLKKIVESEIKSYVGAAATVTKFDLLRLASHCKNSYYSEEQEWRLALPHLKGTPLTDITIEHRGPNNQIPYIAHDLFSGGHLPIVRVLTGPLCSQYDAVEKLVKESGYDIPIDRSQSPLRRIDEIQ